MSTLYGLDDKNNILFLLNMTYRREYEIRKMKLKKRLDI